MVKRLKVELGVCCVLYCVLIIRSLQADNHEALWSDCCGVCVYETMMMMMMMVMVVLVVVSHLVNTTHDNLQLTGSHWLTAPHTILLLSPATDNVGVLVVLPSTIIWHYNSRWQTSLHWYLNTSTFNSLECGQNLCARRLVILYNDPVPVAVVDPGNQIPIIPVISSTTTQPVLSRETNAQQWHFWNEWLL